MASSRLSKTLKKKTFRKHLVRIGLVCANVLALGSVVWFVAAEMSGETTKVPSIKVDSEIEAASPVDAYTSSDVAQSVAVAAGLDDLVRAVSNQAQSVRAAVVMSASDTNIVAKPQIVATSLKSWRDIREYTTLEGDNVNSVAQKFGISANSVRWSNKINGDSIAAGTKLYLPPGEGVVYTVVAGDTPQKLAAKYSADANRIAADNDADIEPLVVGRRIYIANGKIMATSLAASIARRGSFTPIYGYNGYDPGWCTYYAAYKSGAPANWGNANTWAYYARLSGWRVSSVPTAGAIFQTPRGRWGHVGIVEEVSADGTMMKYSDMNGLAGFGRVGYSDWVPSTKFPNYITRN